MSKTIFTATNGLQVKVWQDQPFKGRSRMETLDEVGENMLDGHDFMGNEEIEALREFFQYERDEELGRWRWPEDRNIVVYYREHGKFFVHAYDERDTAMDTVYRHVRAEDMDPNYVTGVTKAGLAYFDAHPEDPKPWHNAQEGEVWVITPCQADPGVEYPAIFQAERFRDHGGSWGAEDLIAARRIWPTED